jgi:hypothetical protein
MPIKKFLALLYIFGVLFSYVLFVPYDLLLASCAIVAGYVVFLGLLWSCQVILGVGD